LFVLAIAALLADKSWSEKQQLDLITSFYKDHLARPESRQASQLPTGSFFSKELEALVDANLQLCDSLSRGDDICGYGADGDVFLDTQEVPPTLDFERAQFKVERAGETRSTPASTSIRTWDRPTSATFVSRWWTKTTAGGERYAVRARPLDAAGTTAENAAVLARARELADAAGWVFNYLGNEDMLDRAMRFIAFPVQVCDQYGVCTAMKRDDMRLLQALDVLADNGADSICPSRAR
jgi:hypothetical protein